MPSSSPLVGLVASALGVLLGLCGAPRVRAAAGRPGQAGLPAPSLWPVLLGLGMGLTLMLAFGLPPVLQLAQVPPLRVIRRDVGKLKPASLAVLGLGVAGFAALLLAASRDLKLGAIAVGGFAVAVAGVCAGQLGGGAGCCAQRQRGHRAALAGAGHAPALGAAGLRGGAGQRLSVGLLALVLLVLLRTDLIASWRRPPRPTRPTASSSTSSPNRPSLQQATLRERRACRSTTGTP
jgi:putative ABC transport system permease protein